MTLALSNLADITQHFTENPDGFLTGVANVTVTHYMPMDLDGDEDVRDYGDVDVVLFSVGRIPSETYLQEYVNVVGLSPSGILHNVHDYGEGIRATSGDEPRGTYRGPTTHKIKLDTLKSGLPGTKELIQIMRWRDKVLTENGLRPVNTAEVFQAAKNAASSEFFTSLFAGSSVPDRSHLLDGMKILQEQLNTLPSPEDEPLKLDDLVEFRDGRRGKIVELFPVDDKVVVLSPFGQTVVAPYGDVTKVQQGL